jgi:hypothetical protein
VNLTPIEQVTRVVFIDQGGWQFRKPTYTPAVPA